jgi:hypothetical protein
MGSGKRINEKISSKNLVALFLYYRDLKRLTFPKKLFDFFA